MHTHRNPADLLGLGRDPALACLLRACGIVEACITGGASDYDKFLALAEAMPLCEGHPLRDEVNTTLAEATGLATSLCPHTAHLYWNVWVEKDWYGNPPDSVDLPLVCPHCACCEPTFLPEEDIVCLPDPMTLRALELQAWSCSMEESYFSVTGKIPAYRLPADYTFNRPDPYHANLIVGKVADREELTVQERNLLVTQALRVWGQAALKRSCGGILLLRGGEREAVTSLLAYLNASRALPTLVWIPDDPADAGAVSGLYSTVGTGFIRKDGNTVTAYAAVAPIGRAVVVE